MVRELLTKWNEENLEWVFTDLVKCYVCKKGKEAYENNFKKAQNYCGNYLKAQIEILKPKVILCFGNEAYRYVMLNINGVEEGTMQKGIHGNLYSAPDKIPVVFSYHPTQNNANIWVRYKGWDPVNNAVMSQL